MAAAVRSAGALLALLALGAGVARAQLPVLRILSFTMTADTLRPRVEQPFHIVIDVRLAQRVTSLDGVVLPMFGPIEITGDEKQLLPAGAGTEYRETLGVIAHAGGTIAIPPAYLDAIDARDGRAKRFLSTPDLVLNVAGPGVSVSATGAAALRFGALFFGFAIVVALAALVALRRRPSLPAPPEEPSEPPRDAPVEHAIDLPPANPYADALAALRQHCDREVALAARDRIRAVIGATPYETLADVVRRPAAHDPRVRDVLRALERAAFTHDADLARACEAAVAALERYLERNS